MIINYAIKCLTSKLTFFDATSIEYVVSSLSCDMRVTKLHIQ